MNTAATVANTEASYGELSLNPIYMTPAQRALRALDQAFDECCGIAADQKTRWIREVQNLPNLAHLNPLVLAISFGLTEVELTESALKAVVERHSAQLPKSENLLNYQQEFIRYVSLIKENRRYLNELF